MKEPAAFLLDGEHFRSNVLIAFCASAVTIYFGADNGMGVFDTFTGRLPPAFCS